MNTVQPRRGGDGEALLRELSGYRGDIGMPERPAASRTPEEKAAIRKGLAALGLTLTEVQRLTDESCQFPNT